MSLIGRFWSSLRREVTVWYGGAGRDAVLGMGIEEVYRTQPELQAVVSFIATSVAQLPLKCYVRESDESRQRDTEGPLPLLLGDPGADVTGYELVLGTVSDIALYGWSLWWVLPSADKPSGWELRRICPGWAKVRTTDGFSASSYEVRNPTTSGVPVQVPADQCVRFATYNPGEPLVPLSPVDSLRNVLAERASSRDFRNKVWRNGGWFSRYIERPAQDGEWSGEARTRFAKSMKDRFSGPDGVDSGGIPILEDGMKFVESRLNAKEAEWAESMRLTREDVAAAYHLNPAQVWSNDGQTYASVKENARSLYTDTLGPYLRMIHDRIGLTLVPMIGADPRCYAEFDLTAKLAGSFEEQASVMSQSTGGPWMTRNEARAKQNLPAIEGGDELIVPMNVTEGGLASPHDTDPTKGVLPLGKGGPDRPSKAAGTVGPKAAEGVIVLKSRGEPDSGADEEMTSILAHFAERQSRRVLADMAKGWKDDDGDGDPAWWNRERWDRELADDLTPAFQRWVTARALAALSDLGLPSSFFDAARTISFIRTMAEVRARAFNESTLEQLRNVDEATEGSKGSTPEGVFEMAQTTRADRAGTSFATSASAFGTTEAARQAYPRDTDEVKRWKVWHHVASGQPRSEHVRMDGERVGLDERFSNGSMWPGDSVLGPKETCNCHCQVEIEIERRDGRHRRIDEMEIIHEDLYSETPEQVKEEEQRIAKEERSVWENGYRKSDRSSAKYRETYGAFVESFSPEGRIRIEDFTRVESKEIQLAKWLASAGHTVEFRNADDHRKTDGKTTDVILDGVLWEFKRSESKSVKKLATLITKRLGRQGPRFVVDLSVSPLDLGVALEKLANLLDDSNVDQFIVVAEGRASVMRA